MPARARVVALDLEGTLISNAMSQFPRHQLHDFLEYCFASFERVTMLTCVEENETRAIMDRLAAEGSAPAGVCSGTGRLEYVRWFGKQKDLKFVPGAEPEEIVFVDDDPWFIKPSQRQQWVPIAEFKSPYEEDRELHRVVGILDLRRHGLRESLPDPALCEPDHEWSSEPSEREIFCVRCLKIY